MNTPIVRVPQTPDFQITGKGTSPGWEKAETVKLSRIQPGPSWRTTARALYSDTGLYFLFDCEDAALTSTFTSDFADLFLEDVVEIFLQPEADIPVYFEYEASPLGKELPIIVSNHKGVFHGWLPWKYDGCRKCRVKTSVRGGQKQPLSRCRGWRAEIFIPFELLACIASIPPTCGTIWRGNLYRIDCDQGAPIHYAWNTRTGKNFHDFANFGFLEFV